ncbi:hypothetical protein KCP75_11610 [Salmonella enterica subsp. enterica]|nr:hypothetical protein KCP75_11610 [Salmonella enterica subsp. enterica]
MDAGEWSARSPAAQRRGKTTLLRLLTGLARGQRRGVLAGRTPAPRAFDSFHRSLLWIGHQPGIKSPDGAGENLRFFHPGDGARLPEALAQAGLAGI